MYKVINFKIIRYNKKSKNLIKIIIYLIIFFKIKFILFFLWKKNNFIFFKKHEKLFLLLVYVNVNYCNNYLKIAIISFCFYYILINNCHNFLIKNSHLSELGVLFINNFYKI